MKPTILFTYPRSGNTWLRYIFECITGYPSLGTPDNLEKDLPLYQRRKGIPVVEGRPPMLFKRHLISQFSPEDFQLPLIIILRNYKECVVRQKSKVLEDVTLLDWQFKCYLAPIRQYHQHAYPKLLIYYEDLIQSPEAVIRTFGTFVNAPQERINSFLNNFKEHQIRSIQNYEDGSQTFGASTHFHQLQLSSEHRQFWDRKMRKEIPLLFDKYLSRYLSLASIN